MPERSGGWDSAGRLGERRPRAANRGGRMGPGTGGGGAPTRFRPPGVSLRQILTFLLVLLPILYRKAGRGVLSSELGVKALSACLSLE